MTDTQELERYNRGVRDTAAIMFLGKDKVAEFRALADEAGREEFITANMTPVLQQFLSFNLKKPLR